MPYIKNVNLINTQNKLLKEFKFEILTINADTVISIFYLNPWTFSLNLERSSLITIFFIILFETTCKKYSVTMKTQDNILVKILTYDKKTGSVNNFRVQSRKNING